MRKLNKLNTNIQILNVFFIILCTKHVFDNIYYNSNETNIKQVTNDYSHYFFVNL